MSDAGAIRFSLLHPSRNRMELAARAMDEWMGRRSGDHAIEYILSIDDDDANIEGYRRLAERHGAQLLIGRNRSLVDATNRAAARATGDVLIVVSDDFGCPVAWDRGLAAIIGVRRDVAVLVHDGVDGRILTLPILGRDLYRRLGYVYHPAYFSMFADDDLTATVRALGKLVDARAELTFRHRHHTVRGGVDYDETYARQDSNAAWWAGWRVFEKRRAGGFGLRPRTPRVMVREIEIDARYFARIHGSRVKQALRRAYRRVRDRR